MKGVGKGLVVNPVIFLFIIYLFANFYSFLTLILGGDVLVDALVRRFNSSVIYITGVAIISSLLLIMMLYGVSVRFFGERKKELFFTDNWGWFLLLLQCAFWVNNILYNVNRAGAEEEGLGSPFKLFFNILQPDLIYLVIAIGLVSARLFWINLVVFAFSMLSRGWIGGFLIVFVMYLCWSYPVRISGKRLFLSFFGLSTCVLLFPFFVELKWILRSEGDWREVWFNVFDEGYLISLANSFEYLLSRFQMFGHVALIAENSNEIADAYASSEFIPYWADGMLQWLVLKIYSIEIFQLNRYMVSVFFDANNMAYSTNPGIAGWMLFLRYDSLLFLSYIFVVVLLPAFLLSRYAGRRYVLMLFSLSLIYLFHGWIGAYFNAVFYLLFIIFLKSYIFKRIE